MISVLMSVYNERLEEIQQSIDSVLAQTYSDFELIVVLDRPEYSDAHALLQEYAAKDDRVRILVNEKNIGLALSMNYAAENAKGEYLLRMDADDVCVQNRFQLEYDAIRDGKYDLVCGNYDFVDENLNLLPQKPKIYTDRQLAALLPYRNIIHHPTVIMSAEKFREAGGYRNYPCAQDYDLWLRMKCNGCRMHMLSEKLILYRVRQASITLLKRYKQSCTGEYIRKLYHQKERMAGYSYEGYLKYLASRNANDPTANADFIRYSELYMQAKKELKKGKLIQGAMNLGRVMFQSKHYRPHIWQNVKIALITKLTK